MATQRLVVEIAAGDSLDLTIRALAADVKTAAAKPKRVVKRRKRVVVRRKRGESTYDFEQRKRDAHANPY